MENIQQTIETSWESLLEAIQEAASRVRDGNSGTCEVVAKLETLHSAVRGLGLAWNDIRDMLPSVPEIDSEKPDVSGALSESVYWKPLAKILSQLGGSAKAQEAIAAVGQSMDDLLNPIDREPLAESGQIRWMVRVRFARNTLKNHGLISRKCLHGQWKLTEAGQRWADSAIEKLPAPIEEPDPSQPTLVF
jgi:hypothetical protein